MLFVTVGLCFSNFAQVGATMPAAFQGQAESNRIPHQQFQIALNLKFKAFAGDENAIVELQERCDKNETPSCERLGVLYFYGPEKVYDRTHGLSVLIKACNSGSGFGCDFAASIYNDVFPDKEQAMKYCAFARSNYHKACEQGNGEECFSLAGAFAQEDSVGGDGQLIFRCIEYNLKKTAHYYLIACDLGNDSACINLGVMYRKGEGVKLNRKKADSLRNRGLAIIEEDCIAGDGSQCYARGSFLKDDNQIDEAQIAFRRGCELGDQRSCKKLNVETPGSSNETIPPDK